MIIDNVMISYLMLYIFLELYEVSWQKAPTMMGMIVRMHKHYTKNILVFLLMQPTFYFAIGFAMITNYNPYALMLLFIKTVDIATKIILIEKVFIKKEITHELSMALIAPLNKYLPYIGLGIYPFLIILAVE